MSLPEERKSIFSGPNYYINILLQKITQHRKACKDVVQSYKFIPVSPAEK